jgi:CRISPR-associated protein Csb1
MVGSTIRAYDIDEVTRSSQYVPPVKYAKAGLIDDPRNEAERDSMAAAGLVEHPAVGVIGGVIAKGGIFLTASLALSQLQSMAANGESNMPACRYLLGLAAVSFASCGPRYLRQGCDLVLKDVKSSSMLIMRRNGKHEPFSITQEEALAYAYEAAKAFGIGPDQEFIVTKESFSESVAEIVRKKKDKDDKGKARNSKATAEPSEPDENEDEPAGKTTA